MATTAGAENLRRILTDWLSDIGLIPAGHKALLDRYVGYYRPYATSHDDLDADLDFQTEVKQCRAHARPRRQAAPPRQAPAA